MIIAEAAWDRSTSRQVLRHKRAHYITLETLFVSDHRKRNTNGVPDGASVVHNIQRTTAARPRLGHALVSGKPPLIPKLHGQPYNVMPLGAQHGRHSGGIDSARHCYGDGLRIWHS